MEFRSIAPEIWNVSRGLGTRRSSLMSPPEPLQLLKTIGAESLDAALNGRARIDLEPANDPHAPPLHYRVVGVFPVTGPTFDAFFNGRSGYRAQYYFSPETGEAFNRAVIDKLFAAFETAVVRAALQIDRKLLGRSLTGRYSKVWVFDEKRAFDEAMVDGLTPERWTSKPEPRRGCRAPLPSPAALDVKGTFVHIADDHEWVDPIKLSRSLDLHEPGWT